MSNSDDVLIKVENVSKKFCRSLKRSMLYGIEDISRDLIYLPGLSDKLRKDEFWAVDDVSFEVRRSECLAIIGRNGAGFRPMLTGRENVYVNGAILDMSKREIDKKLRRNRGICGLEEFIEMPI